MDSFSIRRLTKFIEDFRKNQGQLPTLQDFAEANFSDETVKAAEKLGKIEKFYVTLTNGTIRKGYKVKTP